MINFMDAWGTSAYDDVSGQELDAEEVQRARAEEMKFVKSIPVDEERDVKQCGYKTSRKPITTKWVDHQKADGMKCRWVARDFKVKGDGKDDLFAAMPPLEAKKTLFALAAPRLKGRLTNRGRKMKIMFIDLRKAHLNAKVDQAQDICVELQGRHKRMGNVGNCRGGCMG